ncbi:MAG: lysophospholipase [Eubacterium sp.]|nr:lysophospholipase [Eubacterium sp.]
MKIEEYRFPSATGVCEIVGNSYKPEGEVKAVFAIHHGMAEHQERYRGFIEYLVSNGYAVFMHDMTNHGKSNVDFDETGYFGEKDGYKALIEDFKTTFEKAREEYPDKKIIVMGHSMGSFIVRCFTAQYNQLDFAGAIYMGTGGANPIAGVGDKISALVAKMKGSKHKSKTLDKMSFGSYNKKFEGRTAFDWLTKDTDIVDKYIADEYCGFLFSAQGMNDLVKLNIEANTDEWYKAVRADLPIYLVSGEMDPVGEYSKGIRDIYQKLLATDHKKVTLKLYPNDRHEILNETDKEKVMKDLTDWAEQEVL